MYISGTAIPPEQHFRRRRPNLLTSLRLACRPRSDVMEERVSSYLVSRITKVVCRLDIYYTAVTSLTWGKVCWAGRTISSCKQHSAGLLFVLRPYWTARRLEALHPCTRYRVLSLRRYVPRRSFRLEATQSLMHHRNKRGNLTSPDLSGDVGQPAYLTYYKLFYLKYSTDSYISDASASLSAAPLCC